MKKPLVVLVLIVIIAGGGYAWYQQQTTNHGPPTLYGNVDVRELSLAFRQSGRVTTMHVQEGDRVSRGDTVAELDDEPLRHALSAAQARVASARASLDRLEAGSRSQEIEQAKEAEREALAVFANRQLEFRRLDRLASAGATSQRSLDSARYALDEARARLAGARATLSLLEEGARKEDIRAAKAQLELAQAEERQARTALSDALLTAPSDGLVLSRVVEPGAMVQAGAPVATLALRDPVYVRAYVSEPQLGLVSPGTPVRVTTDSSNDSYHGQVGFVSPRAEFTPKTVQSEALRTELVYRLRIVVNDADNRLLQGMPVTVTLDQP